MYNFYNIWPSSIFLNDSLQSAWPDYIQYSLHSIRKRFAAKPQVDCWKDKQFIRKSPDRVTLFNSNIHPPLGHNQAKKNFIHSSYDLHQKFIQKNMYKNICESLINKACVAVMNCKTPHFYKPIRSLAFVVQPSISVIPLIFKILFLLGVWKKKD